MRESSELPRNRSRGIAIGPSFARFVSLACHDLRTPLATVHGFARTLVRREGLDEVGLRYLGMIEAASEEMADLLDAVALAARIEDGRYEPNSRDVDLLALAEASAERLDAEQVTVAGRGETVSVDVEASERAIASLAKCALRHGGLKRVEIAVRGAELVISPIAPSAAPVIAGEQLRDLGAAVARRVVEALDGSFVVDGERLVVSLPRPR